MRYNSDISICTLSRFSADAETAFSRISEPVSFSISVRHQPAGHRPTFADIHWLAGLFEGEGSFAANEIKIPQKDPEILFWVLELFGGRVLGPHRTVSPYTGKTSWRYVWTARNHRAKSIAYTIYHLLSTRRREQAWPLLAISRDDHVVRLRETNPTEFLWDWMTWAQRQEMWLRW